MNTLERVLDILVGYTILLSMTTLWLPWHNMPPLALLLMQLLSKVEPVVMMSYQAAFAIASHQHQHGIISSPTAFIRRHTPTIFAARINGQSDDIEEEESSTKRRRKRKLVDRSNFYSTTTTSTSSRRAIATFDGEDEEELCFLDDLPGTDAEQTCFMSSRTSSSTFDDDDNPSSLPYNKRRIISSSPTIISMEFVLKYLPFLMPIIAYSTYESTARSFNRLVEFISDNNWIAVDGGQYQAEIITPAINGLVVPSLALLFATLMNNTINTLRQRQLQIRTSLNTEANDLRMLLTILDSLPIQLQSVKNHLREYLIQYSSRVISECQPRLSLNNLMYIGSMDNELNGFLLYWNGLSMSCYGTMYIDTLLPASNYTVDLSESALFGRYENQLGITTKQRQQHIVPFMSPTIFSETYDALTRLRNERSIRISALQSTYPMLHYVILALLAGSICTVFLMETNQDLLLFLSAIQLRVLWSMLIGTFSALGVVNYDMIDPFSGSCEYNICMYGLYHHFSLDC
jgi:hypothetical protein